MKVPAGRPDHPLARVPLRISLVVSLVAVIAAQAPAQNADERLWNGIRASADSLFEVSVLDTRDAIDRRERLAGRCREYVRLYPGGRMIVDAADLELRLRFQIDALRGTGHEQLHDAARYYSAERFPPAIRAEAAYWLWLTRPRRDDDDPLATIPADRMIDALDFIEQYHTTRRGRQMLEMLCEQLEARPNDDLIVRLLAMPIDRPTLTARLDRLRMLGEPFPAVKPDGAAPPPADSRPDGPFILLMAASSDANHEELEQIAAALRARHGDQVRLISSIDRPPPAVTAFHQSLPDSTAFNQKWLQRPAAECFVIDRAGVLRAILTPEQLEALELPNVLESAE